MVRVSKLFGSLYADRSIHGEVDYMLFKVRFFASYTLMK